MPRLAVHANTIKRTEANPYTGEESERDIPFMKGYAVFNVEQVEARCRRQRNTRGCPPSALRRPWLSAAGRHPARSRSTWRH